MMHGQAKYQIMKYICWLNI